MIANLRSIVLEAPSKQSHDQPTAWLVANKVGEEKLHGNKQDGGNYGMTNDAAVIWPPGYELVDLKWSQFKA